jgi:hypothetical protein
VFEDDHAEIFGRPFVNASRLVLGHLLAVQVDTSITQLKNSLFAKYALTRYLMLYIVRLVLEEDEVGKQIIDSPREFVSDKRNRAAVLTAVSRVLGDIVIDLNAEVAQLGEDFDYRGKLRDEAWVKSLAHKVVSDHRKLVARDRILPFASEFHAAVKAAAPKKKLKLMTKTPKPVKSAKRR